MPDGDGASGTIRTLEIRKWRIQFGRVAPVLVGLLLGAIAGQLHLSYTQYERIQALAAKNAELRGQIRGIEGDVDQLAGVVSRLQQFDARLRNVTQLSDPGRKLAMGPVGAGAGTNGPDATGYGGGGALRLDLLGSDGAARAVSLIEDRVAFVGDEAQTTEASVRDLHEYLEAQQALLARTPSLSPTTGWRTSNFGNRTDPYTGVRQMHSGIDIASEIGRTIVAPGDGLVTFSGVRGAYGNVVVLDHGSGLTTIYAHMDKSEVNVGQALKRGVRIGAVGNSGRSTGPHLHYEIRFNGVPQDPDRFILD